VTLIKARATPSCYAADMTHSTVAQVHDFLTQQPTGVLSTASSEGEPWAATVVFAVDEELNFYFMTRAKTLKYKNIATNPHIALTVTDPAGQKTVQAAGVVERVATEDIIETVFQKLDKVKPRGSEHWIAPVYKVHEGDYMILKLKPTYLQYADFSLAPLDPNSNFIERII
jgi:general stress protein 26